MRLNKLMVMAILCLILFLAVWPVAAGVTVSITAIRTDGQGLIIEVDPGQYREQISGYRVWLVDRASGETVYAEDLGADRPIHFAIPLYIPNGDYTVWVKPIDTTGAYGVETGLDIAYDHAAAVADNNISPLVLVGGGALVLLAIAAFFFMRSSHGNTTPKPAVVSNPPVSRQPETRPIPPPVTSPAPVQPAVKPQPAPAEILPPVMTSSPPPHATPSHSTPRPDSQTIFVSYSRADYVQFIEPMIKLLNSNDLLVWLDQHLLESGDDWLDKIGDALETCDRMILCVSPDALESRFVKMEYRYFFNHGKKIYPLICRAATDVPPELQGIQYFPYERLNDLIGILKRPEAEPHTGD